MKKTNILFLAFISTVTIAVIACNSSSQSGAVTGEIVLSKDSMVKRGAYLVTMMGCNDCHTPMMMTDHGPAPDPSKMLSGYPAKAPLPPADHKSSPGWIFIAQGGCAMSGPWGTSFAANLTSDETGIGNWSEAQFIKCMREGKLKGMDNGRKLLPLMPWQNYINASEVDLKAIFAYLKSTPPVDNVVPAPLPPASN